MKLKHILTVVIILLLGALGAILVIPIVKASKPVEVTVVVEPSISSLPIYLAQDKGIFEEEKITANVVTSEDAQQAFDDLAAGNVEFCLMPWPEAFKWMEKTSDTLYCFFSVEFKRGSPQEGIFVGADVDLPDLLELEGKSIGITSTSDAVAKAILGAVALDESLVEIKVFPPAELITALETGEVDLILPIEPYYTVAEQKLGPALDGGGVFPVWINDPYVASGLFVTSEFVEKNSMSMIRMNKALNSAYKTLSTKPDTALAVAGRSFGIDDSAVVSELNIPIYLRIDDIDVDDIQQLADKLEFYEAIEQSVNIEDMGLIIPRAKIVE